MASTEESSSSLFCFLGILGTLKLQPQVFSSKNLGKNLFLFLLFPEMEAEFLSLSGFSGLHRFHFVGRIQLPSFEALRV